MRRISRILIGCLCLILYPALTCSAKEWHGIVPLHTTRSEVIKLFGTPKHTYTNLEYFDVADDEVMIYWIDPTCERPYVSEEYEAQDDVRPGDLVLNIIVYPKKPRPAKEIDIPNTLYMTMGCFLNGPCTVWSFEAGFGYTKSKGGVTRLHYGPTEAEFKAWSSEHKGCHPKAKNAT